MSTTPDPIPTPDPLTCGHRFTTAGREWVCVAAPHDTFRRHGRHWFQPARPADTRPTGHQ